MILTDWYSRRWVARSAVLEVLYRPRNLGCFGELSVFDKMADSRLLALELILTKLCLIAVGYRKSEYPFRGLMTAMSYVSSMHCLMAAKTLTWLQLLGIRVLNGGLLFNRDFSYKALLVACRYKGMKRTCLGWVVQYQDLPQTWEVSV